MEITITIDSESFGPDSQGAEFRQQLQDDSVRSKMSWDEQTAETQGTVLGLVEQSLRSLAEHRDQWVPYANMIENNMATVTMQILFAEAGTQVSK